jgi:uncharacterized protein (TIGR00369 family)
MTVQLNTAAEARVRRTFTRQTVMNTFGAELTEMTSEHVEICMPFDAQFGQQHGYLHAGVISSLVDSANGLAALSLLPEGAAILAVEFKVNFVAPARGESFVARGRVLKSGRTLSVCSGDVHARVAGEERLVATMMSTCMALEERGIVD